VYILIINHKTTTTPMTTRYRTTVIFAACLVSATFGTALGQQPLTFENSIMPLLGQEVTLSQYESTNPSVFAGFVTKTGENQTWDFTAGTFGDSLALTTQYLNPPFDGLPGANRPEFANANFVQVVTDTISADFPDPTQLYNYSSASDTGIVHFGYAAALDVDDDQVVDTLAVLFNPSELDFRFPASLGTEWDSETMQSFVFGGNSFPGATVTRTNKVVGSGMLITPAGSAQAYMVDQTFSSQIAGFGPKTRSIQFVTPLVSSAGKSGIMSMYAEIELDQNDAVTSASYTVLRAGGGQSTAAENPNEIPETIKLGANYPNPFNPSTSIPYSLDKAAHVSMAVYDVLGRQVDLLVDGFVSSGSHTVTWQADDLPSGVYQVVLESGADFRVRTMVLQK
jgi:hypothetical protein